MADDAFEHDLRRVLGDHADVEPPAALDEWLADLPAQAARRRPSRLRFARPLAAAVLMVGVLAAAGVYWARLGPSGPAALPSGQPLAINVEPTVYPGDACRLALRSGVQMQRAGGEVVFSQGGQDEAITWPYGTKALLVNDKAELFAPDGTLIAVEGETLPDLGGGLGVDDRFHVCAIGGLPHR
jgi:hypothetical protein